MRKVVKDKYKETNFGIEVTFIMCEDSLCLSKIEDASDYLERSPLLDK